MVETVAADVGDGQGEEGREGPHDFLCSRKKKTTVGSESARETSVINRSVIEDVYRAVLC